MSDVANGHSVSIRNGGIKRQENHKDYLSRDVVLGGDLWTDGLICAFEFVRGHRKMVQSKPGSKIESAVTVKDKSDENNCIEDCHSRHLNGREDCLPRNYWIPIGWKRISQLVQAVQIDAGWASQSIDFPGEEDDVTVADLAAPYWERAVGPTWWCHVSADHPNTNAWLSNAQWLHPAISIALRDESKLISERMKHLLYEVPVRVAGGLLFELLGQSAGDPFVYEDDIPIVLRSWQAQNFLVTALHVKGSASNINVLGIAEVQVCSWSKKKSVLLRPLFLCLQWLPVVIVIFYISSHDIVSCFVQELLTAGGGNIPRTIHEVVAHLACRLARWDDRLFRKSIFGAADEVELKFMDRRTHEDVHLFRIILNQEIRRLSTQVIRVKWSLHAREEIVFELLQHLKGNLTRGLLEGIRKSTREMIEEQEAVRGRLFTIQDVMQSTVRAWLQVYIFLTRYPIL